MKKSFGNRLVSLFKSKKQFDESFFENLEDLLIEGDLGAVEAFAISEKLQVLCKKRLVSDEEALNILKSELSQYVKSYFPIIKKDQLNLILVLGVNGVGKTTTIAKLACKYLKEGYSIVMSAADTFRAAASDQLQLHADRVGCRIVKQNPGSDPGSVIYDTITSASAKKEQIILADTAGRMHTKDNLLKELQKIDKIICNRIPIGNYTKILVIDSTTGQNGIRQAEMFNNAIGVDAIILTKYDSASKGGSVIQIGKKLNIPISFIGTGETYNDISIFDKEEFLNTLLGIE
ncbi:MAG: signal recognition particle-docking protein FtsY [Bacteroidetes bacterium]|nr:signal recognition particle-docking protein FtsY [Bacteroidota bacterium]